MANTKSTQRPDKKRPPKLTPLYEGASLPDPSIMKKLEDAHPGATERILEITETIQKSRHREEEEKLKSPDERRRFLKKEHSPQTDWIKTGNDLKKAITAFMQEKRLTCESIRLTPQEQESLTLGEINSPSV